MTESDIIELAREALDGVAVVVASEASGAPEVSWGDSFFFYDPSGDDPSARRMPFATIVVQDYEGFDTASNLDRPGVFRVNLWVGTATVQQLFGDRDQGAFDFTALDTPLPHPVYGAQGWVSILNPGPRTAELTRTLLVEAHSRAVTRHERRASR